MKLSSLFKREAPPPYRPIIDPNNPMESKCKLAMGKYPHCCLQNHGGKCFIDATIFRFPYKYNEIQIARLDRSFLGGNPNKEFNENAQSVQQESPLPIHDNHLCFIRGDLNGFP
jgi:hypothetical protein